jgi:hypothetical protein
MKINTLMRDGLLEAVKNKTLLSHIKNEEYVQTEIEALNKFPASYATRIIPLTCIQLIIDIFTVMAKRGGSGKSSLQALCTPPDPSSVSFAAFEKQLLDAKAHLMALRPASAEQVAEIMEALYPATRGWKEGIWENQDGKRTQPLQPLHYGEANDSETLGHLVAFPDCPRTPTTEV